LKGIERELKELERNERKRKETEGN